MLMNESLCIFSIVLLVVSVAPVAFLFLKMIQQNLFLKEKTGIEKEFLYIKDSLFVYF